MTDISTNETSSTQTIPRSREWRVVHKICSKEVEGLHVLISSAESLTGSGNVSWTYSLGTLARGKDEGSRFIPVSFKKGSIMAKNHAAEAASLIGKAIEWIEARDANIKSRKRASNGAAV